MVRVFHKLNPQNPIFSSTPKAKHEGTCYQEALKACRHYIRLSRPLALLEDIAQKADDEYLEGSDYAEAAQQLLQVVFASSDLRLEQFVEEVGWYTESPESAMDRAEQRQPGSIKKMVDQCS